MLLRSSSTPILGSLLPSFSDSPNNNNTTHFHDTTNSNLLKHKSLNKLPYHHINLSTVSCSSSPMSPSIADLMDHSARGFRRAQSEGNLEGLAYASCCSNEGQCEASQPKKLSGKSKCLMLETIPSFSFYGLRCQNEDDKEEEWRAILDEGKAEQCNHFDISNKRGRTVSSEGARVANRTCNDGYQEERASTNEELHLARGLGIYGGTNNGGRDGGDNSCRSNFPGGEGGDMNQIENYYKKMLQENPGNPLFLRNYAQFLCQAQQDLPAAEEYYLRAILANPKDGEVLSQYARLIWEAHHDQYRALGYFERAVQASPEDSHVHAAYASFLWEVGEDKDECNITQDFNAVPPSFCKEAIASASA